MIDVYYIYIYIYIMHISNNIIFSYIYKYDLNEYLNISLKKSI